MTECLESKKISNGSKVEFSLDVLTDGSEHTGHGTVFLTVQKIRSDANTDELFSPHILARYAMSGISSLTARLASDQNFQLSAVRAVFLPTIQNVNVIVGFPSLLLSLSNYSMSETLYVVGDHGVDHFTEKISDLILSRRAYPKIASCEVPSNKNFWWNVYSDEYIVVHGKIPEGSNQVVYIVGLKNQSFAFAVIPPKMKNDSHKCWMYNMFHNLSEEVTTKNIDSVLDLILHLDPIITIGATLQQKKTARYNLATIPNCHDRYDPCLLIRATNFSNMLHSVLPSVFLFSSKQNHSPCAHATESYNHSNHNEDMIALKTGTSVILPTKHYLDRGINTLRFINRMIDVRQKMHSLDEPFRGNGIPESITNFYSDPLTRLEQKDSNEISLDDSENEDSFEADMPKSKRCKASEEHIFRNLDYPRLAILGTGCSSPSPLRNSSGHVILLESKLSIVLECGEGFLTMLGRQIRDASDGTKHIRLIWISHAHLDHYGDLPVLIESIRHSHESNLFCNCYDNPGTQNVQKDVITESEHQQRHFNYDFCGRCQRRRLPILIAPTKVLKYVDVMLGTTNGRQKHGRLFVGLSHQDFNHSPFAKYIRDDLFGLEIVGPDKVPYRVIHELRNIPVDHCQNSFGLIIALGSMNADSKIFTICYSGDTRPSSNLIRACKDYSRANIKSSEGIWNSYTNKISLLIHEATFDNDTKGQEEAQRRRHSTVNEALEVATQIEAECLILTHFSQRYPMLPPSYNSTHVSDNRYVEESPSVASAYDGMIIPCKRDLKKVLPTLENTLHSAFLSFNK